MAENCVILLHGILRSKYDMMPLTWYLKRKGYRALNILYPSRQKNLEQLTDYIDEKVQEKGDPAAYQNIHFVTHSMGSLIARYYIASRQPENLGRVVMLGPPNTGSEFADFLRDHKNLSPVYDRVFGPAGQQLATDYDHADGEIGYQLGIIAGSRSINPLAPFVLPKGHDGIVPIERTKIDGMSDHIVMPVTHSLMMFNPSVIRQVHHFLKNGKFKS